MKGIEIGDTLISPQGRKLTVLKWLPGKGLFVIGKWLLRDGKGVTLQLTSVELRKRQLVYLHH